MFAGGFLGLPLTVCSYKKLAIFTTNIDVENQCLTNHKCVYGALNRQFFVGTVMCYPSVCRCFSVHCLLLSWRVGLVALLDFFALDCAIAKNTNVPLNALAILSYYFS